MSYIAKEGIKSRERAILGAPWIWGETDYLSGAGRWLQARQENSTCYDSAPGTPSCHFLRTQSIEQI